MPQKPIVAALYHVSFMPVGVLLAFSWLPITVRFSPYSNGGSIPGFVFVTLLAALLFSAGGLLVRFLYSAQIKRRSWDTLLQVAGLFASIVGLLLCLLDRFVVAGIL